MIFSGSTMLYQTIRAVDAFEAERHATSVKKKILQLSTYHQNVSR